MNQRLRRLPFCSLPALALWATLAALPLTAQNPASAAPVPPPSGRPADSHVTLKLNTAFTGDTPFAARGTSVGSFSVAQFGAELAVPLAPVGGKLYPVVSLSYRDYSLDRDADTPLPDRLKSLGAAFTVFTKLDADWSLLASVSPGVHNSGTAFSSKGFGVGVIAIASRKFTPNFGAGFGFVYDSLSKGTGRIIPSLPSTGRPLPPGASPSASRAPASSTPSAPNSTSSLPPKPTSAPSTSPTTRSPPAATNPPSTARASNTRPSASAPPSPGAPHPPCPPAPPSAPSPSSTPTITSATTA